jgi:hypothetical protein
MSGIHDLFVLSLLRSQFAAEGSPSTVISEDIIRTNMPKAHRHTSLTEVHLFSITPSENCVEAIDQIQSCPVDVDTVTDRGGNRRPQS